MIKILRALLHTFILGISSLTLANMSFKCISQSVNPEVERHEVVLSFEPVRFDLVSYFKEEDGTWSKDSEVLADAVGILRPVKMNWNACKVELKSETTRISYRWSKGDEAEGFLLLDLNSRQGEFYSAYRMGGTVSRRVRFEKCEELPSL